MKIKELRDKEKIELENLANQERSKLSQLRFSRKANQLKDYSEISKTRKNIARILTIVKEKDSK